MTITEIIKAVNQGNMVYWCNELYEVRTSCKGSIDPLDFYIYCNDNGSVHGLVNKRTLQPLNNAEDFFISGRYNGKVLEEGDMVLYTHLHADGITSTTVETMVESVSDGVYPIVTLFNGHRAQWDGKVFRMEGINAVLQIWE